MFEFEQVKPTPERKCKVNIVVSLIMVFLGLTYLLLIPGQAANTRLIDSYQFSWLTGQTFPFIAVFLLLVSSILNLLQSILRIRGLKDKSDKSYLKEQDVDSDAAIGISGIEMVIISGITTVLLSYIWGMVNIGYLFATPVFISMVLLILGYRKYLNIILLSSIPTLVLYFLFSKVLYVPLPIGVLGNILGLY